MGLSLTLKNREYSLNYGPKQLQYIIGLEAKVEDLQAEVKINSPRIEYSTRENSLLRAENFSMKQKLRAMSGELVFKEGSPLI
ncbi:hypothetical protein PanWU01x14_172980 [Parasponia andersonii]|uniref:Uncharacterized protein n=1 Tax=Parasponia andersonii TaxID=3476 RepID=A0A2P5C952_PARAD|nr:hypothetical protein PanWU01x14_172980 [Parasponia andersonii]